jgi:hypothetical protein
MNVDEDDDDDDDDDDDHIEGVNTTSLNCGHQRAYCSSLK